MENNEKKSRFVMATFTIPLEIKSDTEIEAMPDYTSVVFKNLANIPEKATSTAHFKLLLSVLKLTKTKETPDEPIVTSNETDLILPSDIKPRRPKSNIISFKSRSKYSQRNSAKNRPLPKQEDKVADSSVL
jgi:hypothetical protein